MRDLIERYMTKVLGARGFFAELPEPTASQPVDVEQLRIALVELSGVELNGEPRSPALVEMATKICEAVRAEWLKAGGASDARIAWLQSSDEAWAREILIRRIPYAIVFGAHSIAPGGVSAVLAPTLLEMQASPAVKKQCWADIQKQLKIWASCKALGQSGH